MRAATDSKLIELQKKFSSLKETNERGEKSREKLSGELKDVKKKVIVDVSFHAKINGPRRNARKLLLERHMEDTTTQTLTWSPD